MLSVRVVEHGTEECSGTAMTLLILPDSLACLLCSQLLYDIHIPVGLSCSIPAFQVDDAVQCQNSVSATLKLERVAANDAGDLNDRFPKTEVCAATGSPALNSTAIVMPRYVLRRRLVRCMSSVYSMVGGFPKYTTSLISLRDDNTDMRVEREENLSEHDDCARTLECDAEEIEITGTPNGIEYACIAAY